MSEEKKWKEVYLHPGDQQTWGLYKAVIQKMDAENKIEMKVSAVNRKLSEIRKQEVRETYEFILRQQDDNKDIQMVTVLKEC
jgi:hypothetical protein